jgi:hypothetical protein
MKSTPATATENAARASWRIGPPGLFQLTPAECDILARHRRLWAEHCAAAPDIGPVLTGETWQGWKVAARHGDEQALAQLEKFGSEDNFIEISRIGEEGRRARFERENAGCLLENFPMLERAKAEINRQLQEYQKSRPHSLHKVLGVSPTEDGVTSQLRRILADIDSVLTRDWSGGYQYLPNHMAFLESDDDETLIPELIEE